MEDKNIFKIILNYINLGALDKDIAKDGTYISYMGNRKQYESSEESIEAFSKRRITEYFGAYHVNEEKKKDIWKTIEIMVYWDRKNNIAHEITTGMMVPLVFNEQYDSLLPNEVKKQDNRTNLLFCNHYKKPAEFGYFGEINYIDKKPSSKLNLETSIDHLGQLKKYIEEHSNYQEFEAQLKSIFGNSIKYMNICLINMIRSIKSDEEKIHQQEENSVNNDVSNLAQKLQYQHYVEEKEILKEKRLLPIY